MTDGLPGSDTLPDKHCTISLIGMPGCGKSSVGVLLAKLTGLRFIDSDLDIQRREGATLQQIIERSDYHYLRRVEEQVLLDLALDDAVLATGGSAVYSAAAMQRLAAAGPLVYIEVQPELLRERIRRAPPRGIAGDPAQSFADMFAERTALYRRHATLTLDAGRDTPEDIALRIQRRLGQTCP